MDIRGLWFILDDTLAHTIFHPQYFAKRGERAAIRYLVRHARGTLLDIGCGRQPYRKILEPRVKQYVALDHPKFLKHYHSRYPVALIADATKIPLPDRSVDWTMMLWVVEHLPNPERVLQEVHRVLKPNATLVLYAVENYPAHGFPPNYQRFTALGLRTIAKRVGFRSVTITSFGNYWESQIVSRNVFLMHIVKSLYARRSTRLFGVAAFLLFAPIIILGNFMALLFGAERVGETYHLGHMVVAKKRR